MSQNDQNLSRFKISFVLNFSESSNTAHSSLSNHLSLGCSLENLQSTSKQPDCTITLTQKRDENRQRDQSKFKNPNCYEDVGQSSSDRSRSPPGSRRLIPTNSILKLEQEVANVYSEYNDSLKPDSSDAHKPPLLSHFSSPDSPSERARRNRGKRLAQKRNKNLFPLSSPDQDETFVIDDRPSRRPSASARTPKRTRLQAEAVKTPSQVLRTPTSRSRKVKGRQPITSDSGILNQTFQADDIHGKELRRFISSDSDESEISG